MSGPVPTVRPRRRLLAGLVRDGKGATAVEYGLILALIVLAVMASLVALGGVTSGMWNTVSAKVASVT